MTNALKCLCFFGFTRTRACANIHVRDGAAPMGLGYYTTTLGNLTVVGSVVGKNPLETTLYPHLLHYYSENSPPIRACTHARARVRLSLFLCSSVVDIYYLIDIYREIATTPPTTALLHLPKSVVAGLVDLANRLKNNKKGRFYA